MFFFIIQTYTTSLLYLILSKPTFHPVYLQTERLRGKWISLQWRKWLGQAILLTGIGWGAKLVNDRREGFYLGLILVWAGPFVLFLWYGNSSHVATTAIANWNRTLAYQFVIGLPFSNTVLPVCLPTFYLWVVDTLALQRGTWVIQSGTKLGWHLWDGLEIESVDYILLISSI